MLVIRQDDFAFSPCSPSELMNFWVQSSFRIDIFELRHSNKKCVILAYYAFFCEVLTEKSILKPIYPYVNAAFHPLFCYLISYSPHIGDNPFIRNTLSPVSRAKFFSISTYTLPVCKLSTVKVTESISSSFFPS